MLMPFQLPLSTMPEIFGGGGGSCDVRTIVLARENRSAEYADWQRAQRPVAGSAWASMSLARFSEIHDEWFGKVGKAAARTPLLRLTSEAVVEVAAAGPAATGDAQPGATLQSLATFLGTGISAPSSPSLPHHHHDSHHHHHKDDGGTQEHAATAEATPALSVAAAKAASHVARFDELSNSKSARKGRAVVFTAATAFLATCLAGTCFAVGVAVGQRHRDGRYRVTT